MWKDRVCYVVVGRERTEQVASQLVWEGSVHWVGSWCNS
jgi:hypothetical protein